jgi:hypothetical protein
MEEPAEALPAEEEKPDEPLRKPENEDFAEENTAEPEADAAKPDKPEKELLEEHAGEPETEIPEERKKLSPATSPETPQPRTPGQERKSANRYASDPAPGPKPAPVIPPEDTLGNEEEIKSMLEEIDAEEVPLPPESQAEPEPEYETEFVPQKYGNTKPKRIPGPEEGIKLLDYLTSLTASLPGERHADFTSSDYPLKIEAVKNMLRGKQGLHRDFPAKTEESESVSRQSVTPEKITKSFDFVTRLTEYLPNQDAKTVLRKKLKTIEMLLRGGNR